MAEKTIKTYATKGFKNEGVIGSTPPSRLAEKVDGITPDVMQEKSSALKSGIQIIKHNPVKQDGNRGEGMSDTKPVDTLKGKGKSAGNVGSSNMNHTA